MKYTDRTEQQTLIITFQGDLLGATDSIDLMDFINDKINHGIYKCLINMKEVRYMNSSGIGVLVTIYTKFKNRNGEAAICNVPEPINKLLQMTKLDSVIKIYSNEEEALIKLNA